MKVDRPHVALGEVITEARSGFASGDNVPHGVLQVRMNNVTVDGSLDFSTQRRVPANGHTDNFELQKGDILFNATNSPALVGKSAIFLGRDEPVVFSNHFLRLRTNQTRLLPAYLARWLQYQYRHGVFRLLAQQWVNQATVRRERLLALDFPLPPLDEQQGIVQMLDYSARLSARRQQTDPLISELVGAYWQQRFGGGKWRTEALTSLCDCVSGGTPSKSVPGHWDGDVPWFTAKDLKTSDLVNSIDHIARGVIERRRLRLFPSGTVVILVRGMTLRHTLPVCTLRVPGTINQDLKALVPRSPTIDSDFLAVCLRTQSPRILQLVSTAAHGTARLDTSALEAVRIPIPPLAEQQQFAEAARACRQLRVDADAQLHALDELFGSLQHRAFNGEL